MADSSAAQDLTIDQQRAIALASARMRMTAANKNVSGDDAGAGAAFGEGLANSVPAGQKITSAMGAAIAKLNPKEERTLSDLYKQAQEDTETTEKAHPFASGAGTATGVISSLPLFNKGTQLAGKAVNAIPGASTATGYLSGLGQAAPDAGVLAKAGNLAIRSAKSAAVATPVGALYGAANAPSDQMGSGALSGAKAAAEFGAAVPVAGAALSGIADLGRSAVEPFIQNQAVKAMARTAQETGDVAPAINDAAIGKIIKRLHADFPTDDAFQAAIQQYLQSNDVGLAETAGKNVKNLAEASATYPAGATAAENYIENRVGGAKARIAKTFADHVSSSKDYFGTLDDIVEQGRSKASPLYDEAYKANRAVEDPEIDKILATPAGKQALADARTKMMNDRSLMGLPDKELGEQMRDAAAMGEMVSNPGGVAKGLNLRSLDYVKRAMDDQVGAAYRAGENDNGRILTGLKNSLISALDNADETGSYAKARQVSGDYLRASQAMDDGRNFMKIGQPEEIKAHFDALGPTEKDAFKAGIVRQIRETMNNSVDNADLYKRVFGTQTKRDSLAAVLNPSEYAVLEKNMKAEQTLFQLKNQLLGNSRTALRSISAEEFEGGGQQFMQDIATGGPVKAATRAGAKWIVSLFDGLSNKTAGKVADILYETDPEKKIAIAKTLQGASGLSEEEKTTAMKAYFSIDKLFRSMRSQPLAKLIGVTGGNTQDEKPQ